MDVGIVEPLRPNRHKAKNPEEGEGLTMVSEDMSKISSPMLIDTKAWNEMS